MTKVIKINFKFLYIGDSFKFSLPDFKLTLHGECDLL